MIVINPRNVSLSKDLIERYKPIQPASVGHMLEFGFCDPAIRPLWKTFKLVGPAFTVRTSALDSAVVHKAIDMAEPGDVIVIDRNGDGKHACWGEMTALASKIRGLAGAVVDGCATDLTEIEEMQFPVYSRGISAITTKSLALEGEINTQVQIGGIPVNPGDLIVADVNGVLVVPQELAPKIIEACDAREKREVWVREQLKKGEKLSEISKSAERLEAQMAKEAH